MSHSRANARDMESTGNGEMRHCSINCTFIADVRFFFFFKFRAEKKYIKGMTVKFGCTE